MGTSLGSKCYAVHILHFSALLLKFIGSMENEAKG
jgi:hypothetical protein